MGLGLLPGRAAAKTNTFSLEGVDLDAGTTAHLEVYLQGGSDAAGVVDHHVELSLNGILVGETHFDGMKPFLYEADVPVSQLRDFGLSGTLNELSIKNLGDTGVYSRVLLDKVALVYPQRSQAVAGRFDGAFTQGGTASLAGLDSLPALVAVRPDGVDWVRGFEWDPVSLRFTAQSRRALPRRLLAGTALASRLRPRPQLAALHPEPGRLHPDRPPGLPPRRRAAAPAPTGPGPHHPRRLPRGDLLRLRPRTALRRGHPRVPLLRLPLLEETLAPIRAPPRRLLLRPQALLRHRLARSPARPVDPNLLHLDRLRPLPRRRQRRRLAPRPRHRTAPRHHPRAGPRPRRQAARLGGPLSLDGPAALVADNPDAAGDFEANAQDIASSFLAPRNPELIFLSQLGTDGHQGPRPRLARPGPLPALLRRSRRCRPPGPPSTSSSPSTSPRCRPSHSSPCSSP